MEQLISTNLAPIAVLIGVGFLLWAAGVRLIRATFVSTSLFVGGLCGWVVGGMLPEIAGLPVWAMAVVGAGLLACLTALAYRFAVTLSLAAMLAIAAPLTVHTVADLKPDLFGAAPLATGTVVEPPMPEPLEAAADSEDTGIDDTTDAESEGPRWWEQPLPTEPADDTPTGPSLERAGAQITREVIQGHLHRLGTDLGVEPERTTRTVAQIGGFVETGIDKVFDAWQETPTAARPAVITATVIGGLLGILLGAIGPNLSAALLTALGGAVMWLAGVGTLASRMDPTAESWLPTTPSAWLAWWMAASIIGLVIQWTLRPTRADKPA